VSENAHEKLIPEGAHEKATHSVGGAALPDPDGVRVEGGVVREKGKSFHERLRDEHPVEGIAVKGGKAPGALCVEDRQDAHGLSEAPAL
jgi:hypothetical protein